MKVSGGNPGFYLEENERRGKVMRRRVYLQNYPYLRLILSYNEEWEEASDFESSLDL